MHCKPLLAGGLVLALFVFKTARLHAGDAAAEATAGKDVPATTESGAEEASGAEQPSSTAAKQGPADSKAPAKAGAGGEYGPIGKVIETFNRGGPMMWILMGTSVIGLTFALERLSSLRHGKHIPEGLIDRVGSRLRESGPDAARLLVKGEASMLGRVLDGILSRKNANREEQERILEDEVGRALWDMRHNIRPVGIVASVAPLLGLLGTVFGLINAFQRASELGMDDPRNFAEGIYEALYTTAFGLAVAIPFLILYHYLRGKSDVIMREVEDLGIHFIIERDLFAREDAEPVTAETPAVTPSASPASAASPEPSTTEAGA